MTFAIVCAPDKRRFTRCFDIAWHLYMVNLLFTVTLRHIKWAFSLIWPIFSFVCLSTFWSNSFYKIENHYFSGFLVELSQWWEFSQASLCVSYIFHIAMWLVTLYHKSIKQIKSTKYSVETEAKSKCILSIFRGEKSPMCFLFMHKSNGWKRERRMLTGNRRECKNENVEVNTSANVIA